MSRAHTNYIPGTVMLALDILPHVGRRDTFNYSQRSITSKIPVTETLDVPLKVISTGLRTFILAASGPAGEDKEGGFVTMAFSNAVAANLGITDAITQIARQVENKGKKCAVCTTSTISPRDTIGDLLATIEGVLIVGCENTEGMTPLPGSQADVISHVRNVLAKCPELKHLVVLCSPDTATKVRAMVTKPGITLRTGPPTANNVVRAHGIARNANFALLVSAHCESEGCTELNLNGTKTEIRLPGLDDAGNPTEVVLLESGKISDGFWVLLRAMCRAKFCFSLFDVCNGTGISENYAADISQGVDSIIKNDNALMVSLMAEMKKDIQEYPPVIPSPRTHIIMEAVQELYGLNVTTRGCSMGYTMVWACVFLLFWGSFFLESTSVAKFFGISSILRNMQICFCWIGYVVNPLWSLLVSWLVGGKMSFGGMDTSDIARSLFFSFFVSGFTAFNGVTYLPVADFIQEEIPFVTVFITCVTTFFTMAWCVFHHHRVLRKVLRELVVTGVTLVSAKNELISIAGLTVPAPRNIMVTFQSPINSSIVLLEYARCNQNVWESSSGSPFVGDMKQCAPQKSRRINEYSNIFCAYISDDTTVVHTIATHYIHNHKWTPVTFSVNNVIVAKSDMPGFSPSHITAALSYMSNAHTGHLASVVEESYDSMMIRVFSLFTYIVNRMVFNTRVLVIVVGTFVVPIGCTYLLYRFV